MRRHLKIEGQRVPFYLVPVMPDLGNGTEAAEKLIAAIRRAIPPDLPLRAVAIDTCGAPFPAKTKTSPRTCRFSSPIAPAFRKSSIASPPRFIARRAPMPAAAPVQTRSPPQQIPSGRWSAMATAPPSQTWFRATARKAINIAEELRKAPAEPLLPIEKKLIAWSLGIGVTLLVVLALVNRLFPATF
jgi:hypothetical protein